MLQLTREDLLYDEVFDTTFFCFFFVSFFAIIDENNGLNGPLMNFTKGLSF